MDHFFAANIIDNAHNMKSTFLVVIDLVTYIVVRKLVSPEIQGDMSYDELVDTLKKQFKINPTPSEMVYCLKFHSQFKDLERPLLLLSPNMLRLRDSFCVALTIGPLPLSDSVVRF